MTANGIKLHLASRSPRRQELLARLGVKFDSIEVDIEEHWDGSEDPGAYVTRLAVEKAQAGRRAVPDALPVIAADTEVVIDSRVLGKPRDLAAAGHMLSRLSGRTHIVYCAVALLADTEISDLELNRVTFRALRDSEIRAYCATGEPMDKAGGYAIQGRGGAFIARLEGSYSAVMGLPLSATAKILARAGIATPGAMQNTRNS